MARPGAGDYSVRQVRQFLLRYDALRESGISTLEAADRLGLRASYLREWKRREDELFAVPGPWRTVFEGRTWQDMPGSDDILKKLNFALFRRGCLVLNAAGDLVPPEWRHRSWRPRSNRGTRKEPEEADCDLEALRE